MEKPQAVQTASNGDSCEQCGKALPARPSAKEHRFCNAKCRAAWHRGTKQRALNEALRLVDAHYRAAYLTEDGWTAICEQLVAAGAARP